MATVNKTKRKASLGVNFEHGDNGAVVVYDGNEELVLAMIPEGYAVDPKLATALAVKYKSRGRKVLTPRVSKNILDKLGCYKVDRQTVEDDEIIIEQMQQAKSKGK